MTEGAREDAPQTPTIMTAYRYYPLRKEGVRGSPTSFKAVDDEAAWAYVWDADNLGAGVEIWNGTRLVGIVKAGETDN